MTHNRNGLRTARLMTAITTVAAGLALALTPAAAGAAPLDREAGTTLAQVCTVTEDGVNARDGAGMEFPVRVVVGHGQNIDVERWEGDWAFGDLWGGELDVYIHGNYLAC